MKALITGINGFVGPYLKQHLSKNNFEVYGTDISDGQNVDYKADILNKDQIEKLISETAPDFIFHLAAQSSVKLSWSNPELTNKINVKGTKNLLDAIKSHTPDARVLIVSSADIYGIPKKIPLTEKSELDPISPYGKSRLEQEKLVKSYNLNLTVSRSFTHTGPGQKPIFVCSDFAKQVAEIEKGGKPTISAGDITIKRDFTDVRDIAKAYLLALQKCSFNEVYNICSGKSYPLKNILDILLSLTNKQIEIRTDPNKIRKNDIKDMIGDNSKFVKATAWKPEISIEKTLKDILDYWRENISA